MKREGEVGGGEEGGGGGGEVKREGKVGEVRWGEVVR